MKRERKKQGSTDLSFDRHQNVYFYVPLAEVKKTRFQDVYEGNTIRFNLNIYPGYKESATNVRVFSKQTLTNLCA